MAQKCKTSKTISILSIKFTTDVSVNGKFVKADVGIQTDFTCCDPIAYSKEGIIINSFYYNESNYTEDFIKDWINAINEDFFLNVSYEGTSFFGENCFSENSRNGYYEISFPTEASRHGRYYVYVNSFLRLLDYSWDNQSVVGLYLKMRSLLKEAEINYNPYALLDLCHGYFKNYLDHMSKYMYYYYPQYFYASFKDPKNMINHVGSNSIISNGIGVMAQSSARMEEIRQSMNKFREYVKGNDNEKLMELLIKYTGK